ncbi:MAG: hypothetical protein IH845_05125 [Nanoarchaeota archaeon]|nr:hypothetical protein [Nanoarchaeota archaeon]
MAITTIQFDKKIAKKIMQLKYELDCNSAEKLIAAMLDVVDMKKLKKALSDKVDIELTDDTI